MNKSNKKIRNRKEKSSSMLSEKQKKLVGSSKAEKNQTYKIPSSLEGAFAVIVAQNALLLSNPIINIALYNKIFISHFLIISFSLVNCFIVITNWAACKIFYKSNAVLFCNDIITLTLIATVTNVVSGMFAIDNKELFNQRFFFLLMGVYYILIHILYIWWNYTASYSLSKKERGIFKKQNIQNAVSIFLALLLLIITIINYNIFLSQIVYSVSILFWLYIYISFVRTFNVSMN